MLKLEDFVTELECRIRMMPADCWCGNVNEEEVIKTIKDLYETYLPINNT